MSWHPAVLADAATDAGPENVKNLAAIGCSLGVWAMCGDPDGSNIRRGYLRVAADCGISPEMARRVLRWLVTRGWLHEDKAAKWSENGEKSAREFHLAWPNTTCRTGSCASDLTQKSCPHGDEFDPDPHETNFSSIESYPHGEADSGSIRAQIPVESYPHDQADCDQEVVHTDPPVWTTKDKNILTPPAESFDLTAGATTDQGDGQNEGDGVSASTTDRAREDNSPPTLVWPSITVLRPVLPEQTYTDADRLGHTCLRTDAPPAPPEPTVPSPLVAALDAVLDQANADHLAGTG
ncbi:hypothetical protein [Marmoricola sp. RAF53]|uniref:hypothetical protein n=1 Tax=Marmoricola sp. RAF53 TaxID=3233059 RepID=UPI003F96A613